MLGRETPAAGSSRVTENAICFLWLLHSRGRCSVCHPRASLPAQLRGPAIAVHTPLLAYALQFWGHALQICIENLGLAMHEACPVGQRQASIAAREGRAGYTTLPSPLWRGQIPYIRYEHWPLCFPKGFSHLNPSTACAKAQKTARTVWEAPSEFIIQGLRPPHIDTPQGGSLSLSEKALPSDSHKRQSQKCTALQKQERKNKPTPLPTLVSIWKWTSFLLC